MNPSVRVIRTPQEISRIERSWNDCIVTFSKTPFFLSSFAKQFAEFQSSVGWNPFLIVLTRKGRIVGLAPFVYRKLLGLTVVRFLYSYNFGPELFIDEVYKESCLDKIVDFLFETCRCRLIDLVLSIDSLNIPAFRKICKKADINFSTRTVPEFGHRVLPVTGDWDSFLTSRGGKFRRKFRKMKRKLDKAGSLTVECIKNPANPDLYRKILNVEKASWKEIWRNRRGYIYDPDISMLWKASQDAVKIEPHFTWKIWLLELDSHTLAYSLVYEFKKTTFICKISYNEKYRAFYPGIFLINAVVHDSFERGQSTKIDFLTNLPFMATWKASLIPRVRVILGKGILPSLLATGLTNDHIAKTSSSILNFMGEMMHPVNNLFLK